MGLTMSQRKAVTKATATRYRSVSKGAKAVILDELCQLTGWHRDHADSGEDVLDAGVHDRSAPGRGTQTAGAEGPLGDQARVVVEVPDPDRIAKTCDWSLSRRSHLFGHLPVVGHSLLTVAGCRSAIGTAGTAVHRRANASYRPLRGTSRRGRQRQNSHHLPSRPRRISAGEGVSEVASDVA